MKFNGSFGEWIHNERVSAILLLPVALCALILAPLGTNDFFNQNLHMLGIGHSIRDWIALGPLALFFYVAGLEVRQGIHFGGGRSLLPAVMGAAGGMVFAALLFLGLAHVMNVDQSAWGIPMATDLPLALAALSLVTRSTDSRLRQFLVTLAIADDVGSIVVIGFFFHGEFKLPHLLLAVIAILLFAFGAQKRIPAYLLLCIGLIGWWGAAASGIHPTVYGVALGLLMPIERNQKSVKLLEPWTSFLVIPLFLFSALSIEFGWPETTALQGLVIALVVARVLGKPVGIVCGSLLGAALLRSSLPFPTIKLWLVGLLGILGFSVSILFAQLSLSASDQAAAMLGILLALPIGAFGLSLYYFFTRATAA